MFESKKIIYTVYNKKNIRSINKKSTRFDDVFFSFKLVVVAGLMY